MFYVASDIFPCSLKGINWIRLVRKEETKELAKLSNRERMGRFKANRERVACQIPCLTDLHVSWIWKSYFTHRITVISFGWSLNAPSTVVSFFRGRDPTTIPFRKVQKILEFLYTDIYLCRRISAKEVEIGCRTSRKSQFWAALYRPCLASPSHIPIYRTSLETISHQKIGKYNMPPTSHEINLPSITVSSHPWRVRKELRKMFNKFFKTQKKRKF